MNEGELIKSVDIQEIASKGSAIYQKIKSEYEPDHIGHFLAINTTNEEAFLGESSREAVEQARKKYPNEVFYLVKIGYSAVETLARLRSASYDQRLFR